MKVATPDEMRIIDRIASEEIGIPVEVMMENAGRGVTHLIEKIFKSLNGLKVAIVCGKGNNGGDGLVVARHLINRNASPTVFLLCKKEEVKGAAKVNLNILEKMKVDINELASEHDVLEFAESFRYFDLIVDAIFGTGFKGKPSGVYELTINAINESGVPVIAVDVPSGLNCYNGQVEGACVKANYTCTMGVPKRGLYLFPGRDYAGEIHIVDIEVPKSLYKKIKLETIEKENVKLLLPHRPQFSHKGTFGKVLVIAGSIGMTGAASLTSLSCLKIGAGLCYLAIPQSLNQILESLLKEVITIPLPETDKKILSIKALDTLLLWAEKCDVLAIGPGLGRHEELHEIITKIIFEIEKPAVIDADGLNNLTYEDIKKLNGKNIVITPHPGELSRLINMSVDEINKNRVDIAERVAKETGIVVALKGAPTIIASPSGDLYMNLTGNSGLASGGTGDVLTGMIAGLLAQGLKPFEAALCGVYLHGLAGELASKEKTEYSVIASDVMEKIPEALKEVLS